jgi:phosphate-selective porin OprO/OprP
MLRGLPARLRNFTIGWSALACFITANSLPAQPPVREFPSPPAAFFDDRVDEAGLQPVEPAEPVMDRATVESIVREELQADKDAAAAAVDDSSLTASWSNGFVAESADGNSRIHIGGRLEFDNSWFAQDDNILIGNSADQEMRDGTLMRRARFRMDGRITEFIDFATEVNFANIQDVSNADNSTVQVGSVGLTDFFVTFREVPYAGNVRIGHVQAPISLERYSSSNAWYYMERSPMFDAFYNTADYQNGIVIFDSYLDDRMTLAGSATWIGKSDVQPFAFGANEGRYGAGVRLTGLPIYEGEGETLLHLGTGYYQQALVDNKFSLGSRSLLRAGAGGTQTPNLVFTGAFFSPNPAHVANGEAAFIHGPFSLSGEYAVAHISDVFDQALPIYAGPHGDVTYQAAYVEGGVFVTPGDRRRYDVKTGTWSRTVPNEDNWCGAVQLVSRYTFLDLVDGDPILTPAGGGARAGIEHDVTLGVNWYLNSQMWFMLNYVISHVDSVVPGADGDIHGIGCRMHLDF